MKKYKPKDSVVEATQFIKGHELPPYVRYNPRSSPEAFFKGIHGESIIESSDWVILDLYGNRYTMPDKSFKEMYEIIEEKA